MERGTHVCFFLLLCLALLMIGRAQGSFDLYVGGKDGWVTNPSESYSSWAERLRFNVNDSLVFLYTNAVDSVLQVSGADYSSCNAASPITRLATGRDTFKLIRSGPFFFISGNATHCQAGQKLIVVVLAVRSPPSSPAPLLTPPPAPGSTPPDRGLSPAISPTISPTPSGAPSLSPSGSGAPSSSGGSGGLAPSSQSAPGSSSGPVSGVSEPGSAGSPRQPPSGSSASHHSVPSSFPAILAATALTLFCGALLH